MRASIHIPALLCGTAVWGPNLINDVSLLKSADYITRQLCCRYNAKPLHYKEKTGIPKLEFTRYNGISIASVVFSRVRDVYSTHNISVGVFQSVSNRQLYEQ